MMRLRRLLSRIPVLSPLKAKMASWVRRALNRPKWRKLTHKGPVKLELGSGRKCGKDGWTTVDIRGADIEHDLRTGIPLKDNTVDAIYTSHMLEHIPYNDLIGFLVECRRVLKSGGYISVCVPNARQYIQAYIEGRNFRETAQLFQPAVVDTGSLIDQVNYIAYMGGQHATLFDEENLVNTLKTAGFQTVKARDFDPSIDLLVRDFGSIYAVAVK